MRQAVNAILLFLYREQDRKVGPEGFLDSGRYTHSYTLKKRDKARSSYDGSRPSVVSLSSRIERDKKDYNKKVKVIEVNDLNNYTFLQTSSFV